MFLLIGITFTGYSQIITNGSFEEWPDSCAWNTSPIGWTNFSNYSNGPDQRGTYCEGNITPQDGDHYMGLFGCSGIGVTIEGAEQSISGLIPGETYTVSFYAIACDYTSYGVDLKVWAYIDSVPVFESDYLIKNEPWKPYQFTFDADSTSADLAFLTSDWGNYCAFASVGIDNVTIHQRVGISEGDKSDFSIYPNPPTDVLNVNFPSGFNEKIQILDVSGNMVLQTIEFTNGIDVSLLQAGVYFVRLENGSSSTRRFVKH